MTLYRVSIAAKIPANFECYVKARSRAQAFDKAMLAYHGGEGMFEEVITSGRPELDMGYPDEGEPEHCAPGVHIEAVGAKTED